MSSQPVTGGCLCGAIRYQIDAPLPNIVSCHCQNCRRISGSGASFNAMIPTSALKFISGTPKRYVDAQTASGNRLFRFFCADCGSSLCSRRETTPEMTVVKVGTLDDPSALKLTTHIWTSSALPWMFIDPAAEQHPRGRPPVKPA